MCPKYSTLTLALGVAKDICMCQITINTSMLSYAIFDIFKWHFPNIWHLILSNRNENHRHLGLTLPIFNRCPD